ncbi:pre-mRNA-splicing factor 38A [Skeletonema marinoi]|uniref:Pre-mRNA-splicing factor 38 n=1 Tax=Skeletonema marinoi TaxID=267567 RepID=A0AAD9DA38_9STRA|nr:pre-mRNA-splicing factor 38A [Skeletonema marinoi]
MANVTDPLARTVHGKDPQNLIEYITRQKIYDSIYWKEECFGLSASDVATKAIQPEDGILEEFLMNEDFKYVRALGAFYLRWKITHVDEFADELLTSDRYCGIALPHLPKRDVLVSAGYLDGPRRSALTPLMEEQSEEKRKREVEEKERSFREQVGGRESSRDGRRHEDESDRLYRARRDDRMRVGDRDGYYSQDRDERTYDRDERHQSSGIDKRKKEKKDKKYGSLFKKSSSKSEKDQYKSKGIKSDEGGDGNGAEDIDYWNAERAKLGLKPLKED